MTRTTLSLTPRAMDHAVESPRGWPWPLAPWLAPGRGRAATLRPPFSDTTLYCSNWVCGHGSIGAPGPHIHICVPGYFENPVPLLVEAPRGGSDLRVLGSFELGDELLALAKRQGQLTQISHQCAIITVKCAECDLEGVALVFEKLGVVLKTA